MVRITVSYNTYDSKESEVVERIIEILESSEKENKGIKWDVNYTLGEPIKLW